MVYIEYTLIYIFEKQTHTHTHTRENERGSNISSPKTPFKNHDKYTLI